MNLPLPRWFACIACVSLVPLAAGNTTRTEFLRVIERPRVALDAKALPPNVENGQLQIRFSFAADVSQRVPGLLMKSSTSNGRRPVVIALHGTGGDKEGQLPLLAELARKGFLAVAIDGRYHGERAPSRQENSDYHNAILHAYRSGTEHPFFYDTAWDIMRLIDYLETREDVDAQRIGVIGFSKGGIETYLAAAADERIAVVIPCIGVQSFGWAVDNDAWRSRIETIQPAFDAAAREANIGQPKAAFVRAFYDRVAPGIYREFDGPAMLPLIAPRPLLAINGDSDPRTPLKGLEECVEAARRAYSAAGADDKFRLFVQPNTGHKVTEEGMQAAHEWLVRWLQP
jgi:predicted esterase